MLRCTVNDFLLALGEPAPETPLVDEDGLISNWPSHAGRERLNAVLMLFERVRTNGADGFRLCGAFADRPASGRAADARFPIDAFALALDAVPPSAKVVLKRGLRTRWLPPPVRRPVERGINLVLAGILSGLAFGIPLPRFPEVFVAAALAVILPNAGLLVRELMLPDDNPGKGRPYEPAVSPYVVRQALARHVRTNTALRLSLVLSETPDPKLPEPPADFALTIDEFVFALCGESGTVRANLLGYAGEAAVTRLGRDAFDLQHRLYGLVSIGKDDGRRVFDLGGVRVPCNRMLAFTRFPASAFFAALDQFEADPPNHCIRALREFPLCLSYAGMSFWTAFTFFICAAFFSAVPERGSVLAAVFHGAMALSTLLVPLILRSGTRRVRIENDDLRLTEALCAAAGHLESRGTFTRGALRRMRVLLKRREFIRNGETS